MRTSFRRLLSAIPVECVNIMGIPAGDPYAKAGDPPVWAEYRTILKQSALDLPLEPIQKWDFYKKVTSEDHVLTIQTGEQALWANVLLTIGCRQS
jgi:L-fucose mutarotase